MNLIKYFGELKKDLFSHTKNDGLKLVGMNLIYLFLFFFVGLFLLSVIFGKLSFFNDYNPALYEFKATYQQNGQISPAQGTMLIAFYDALKNAFLGSSVILVVFAIFYGFLRGTRTVMLQKIFFKKKLPSAQLLRVTVSNFLFLLLLMLLIGLTLVIFTDPVFVMLLWFLIFLILESLNYSYETRFLFKKKHFLSLFLEHLLFNIIISLIFSVSLLIIFVLSAFLSLISSTVSLVIFLMLFFLMYVKRESILYLIINHFEDVK
ncbi:hypothetical protein JXA48_01250 [Candidatus Woesearchaeota archaeon]|nr:hypothetical protein [Candidatus Woesearchaeota archaeon]